MSKKTVVVTLMALALVASGAGLAQAHMRGWGGGHMGEPYGGGFRGGYGCEGPGAGTAGYGCIGPNAYGRGPAHLGEGVNLTKEEAESLVSFRLRRMNPNLKVGKVVQNEDGFEVNIVTRKGGELVDTLQVDRETGRMYPVR